MTKAKKIEKVIKILIDDKEMEQYHVRQWKHRYEDAKEDGKNSHFLSLIQSHVDDHINKLEEIKMLIDFMQLLHYEEVK